MGYKNSPIYFYNGLALTFTWFVTRILWYTFLGTINDHSYFICSEMLIVIAGVKVLMMRDQVFSRGVAQGSIFVFSYVTGLLLQYFWFFKIVRGSIRVLYPPKNTNALKAKKL